MEKTSDRDIVRMLARKHGSHHRPAFYKEQAKLEFGRTPSSSTITKSIGGYATRLSSNTDPILTVAKSLLSACKHDLPFAEHMLNKAHLT